MIKEKSLSVCGTRCNECTYYNKLCKGCNETKGQVFYMKENKKCSIYECCKKCYNNCSECASIPCDKWMKTRDPKYSDEEFKNNIEERLFNLK